MIVRGCSASGILFFYKFKIKTMKKHYFFALLLMAVLSLANYANAQESFLDRLEVGGQFGLNVQNQMGAVEFSPVVGYRVFDFLTVNAGVICEYLWNKENKMSEWNYGLSAGARLTLFNVVYVEGKGVWNPHVIKYKELDLTERSTDNVQLWAGVGYRQQLSSNAYTYAGIYYDFIPLIKNNPELVNDYNPRVEAGVIYSF